MNITKPSVFGVEKLTTIRYFGYTEIKLVCFNT